MTTTQTNKQISLRNIGSVTIEPSIKWSNIYSFEQLCLIADTLKQQLPDLSIEIFKSHGYCNEVDGKWNVCIAIHDVKSGDKCQDPTYMYLILRRDNILDGMIGGTYGCPFQNNEYIYDLKHFSLSNHKKYLSIIENKLEELMGKAKRIEYFYT